MGNDTTSKPSDGKVHSEKPIDETRANGDETTVQAESLTDSPDPTVLYIVIAVVGVLVLAMVAIVVSVCIKRR